MSRIEIRDIMVYCEVRGEGDPIILLHGNNENSAVFADYFKELSKRFTLYSIDSRGQGETTRGEKPLTYETMAEDVIEFANYMSLDRFGILGFSDGSIIGMIVASKYRDRVSSLALLSANARRSGVSKQFNNYLQGSKQMLKHFKNGELGKVRYELIQLMDKQKDISKKALNSIKCKTLIISGDRDLVTTDETRYMNENIKNSEAVILQDCDHYTIKRTDDVLFLLNTFYGKL